MNKSSIKGLSCLDWYCFSLICVVLYVILIDFVYSFYQLFFTLQSFSACDFKDAMEEPSSGGAPSGEVTPANRTRKRIFDPLEVHADDGNVRRPGLFSEWQETHADDGNARRPGLFSEWQETLKSLGVPVKKGMHENLAVEGHTVMLP